MDYDDIPRPENITAASRDRRLSIWSYLSFLSLSGLLSPLFGSEESGGALAGLFVPLTLLIYICILTIVLVDAPLRRTVVRSLGANLPLLMALALIVFSSLWSLDASTTLRRTGALLGTTLVGFFLYAVHQTKLVQFYARAMLIFVFVSLLLCVFFPAIGTHSGGKFDGLWHGLMPFKNQMGWMAALFLVSWISEIRASYLRFIAGSLVGLIVLVGTGSATGLIVTVVGAAFYAIFIAFVKFRTFRFLLPLFASVISVLGIGYYEDILNFVFEEMGRDATLTGRTAIWEQLWPIIDANPLLGVGYAAFWGKVTEFLGPTNWISGLNHAHNAYMEVLLDIGWLGIIATFAFILLVVSRLIARSLRGDRAAPVMLSLVVCFMAIGVSGALFYRPNTATWIMLASFSAYGAQSTKGSSRDSTPVASEYSRHRGRPA